MDAVRNRRNRFVVREVFVLGLGALTAILFINHEVLYFRGGALNPTAPLASYVLATTVFYLGIRLAVVAIDLRPPRSHAGLERCPECGQWLEDHTSAGLDAHRLIPVTPKPTEKEVLASVALRSAVDAVRAATRPLEEFDARDDAARRPTVNAPMSLDLVRALEDPDALERLLHSPNPPFRAKDEPRLKR